MRIDFEKFKKDMAAFSFGQHQDVLTYLKRLEVCGWTIDDTKKWVEARQKELKRTAVRKIIFTCPDCQSAMRLLRVNVDPATRTDDDSKSVWLCTNKECMNTIYNKKSVEEILKTADRYKEKENVAT